jgi:uncharacterized protein YbcI
MKDKKTKGQVESLISDAIIKFEKEYMGRGPLETKTYIIKDMIFVRLKGVLTPAEEQLTKTPQGADLIKKTRVQLIENARPLLQSLILDVTGSQVKSLHTDISTKTGERVIIFVLEDNYEDNFRVDK